MRYGSVTGDAQKPSTITDFGILPSLAELIALRPQRAADGYRKQAILAGNPGQHAAPHRSRGMEFAEVRPYQSGDDFRTVDWRQTARRGRLYTKLFDEERERPVLLLVDLSASMRFGTRCAFKSVVAARAAAWLAWRAVAAGDRVGGIIWNGGVARELRPQGRDQGALKLIHGLLETSSSPPASHGLGPLAPPLRRLLHLPKQGGMVVLISDFTGLDTDAEKQISSLAQGAELSLIHIYDPFESDAPPPGYYPVTDGEYRQILDLHSAAGRARHAAAFSSRRDALTALAKQRAISLLQLATNADLKRTLSSAFIENARFLPPGNRTAP
jgi:uncharacterized protein (DUF58 family)